MIAAAGMEISWGWMVGGLILFGLTTAFTWIVAAKATGAGQGQRIKSLEDNMDRLTGNVDKLTNTVTSHDRRIEEIRTERSDCETRANQAFATRAEVLEAIKDNKDCRREIFKKLDEVHGRITKLVEQVGRIDARAEKGQT